MKIKVVDDNDMIADMLTGVLAREQEDGTVWEVEFCSSNFDQLLTLEPWKGVDLAILDLMLSDPDINGGHIARFLKEKTDVRVIVFTAISPHFIMPGETDLELLVDLVVNKPLSPLALPDIIRGVMK